MQQVHLSKREEQAGRIAVYRAAQRCAAEATRWVEAQAKALDDAQVSPCCCTFGFHPWHWRLHFRMYTLSASQSKGHAGPSMPNNGCAEPYKQHTVQCQMHTVHSQCMSALHCGAGG